MAHSSHYVQSIWTIWYGVVKILQEMIRMSFRWKAVSSYLEIFVVKRCFVFWIEYISYRNSQKNDHWKFIIWVHIGPLGGQVLTKSTDRLWTMGYGQWLGSELIFEFGPEILKSTFSLFFGFDEIIFQFCKNFIKIWKIIWYGFYMDSGQTHISWITS